MASMAGRGSRASRARWLIAAPLGLLWATQGWAQAAPAGPSTNAMVNLVRLLVAQGTISRDKGDELIAQATREAEEAKAAQLAAAAPTPAPASAPAPVALAAATPPPAGTIRVPYIPETVRAQIRDELRNEIMQTAKVQGWAAPGEAAPEWTRRISLHGDLRLRSQSMFFSQFNSTQVPNFQQIVAGGLLQPGPAGAIDLINSQIPILNLTENRYNQMRFRARLGVDATVNPSIKVGFEFATGNDASPVAANTTLAGGFFKRNVYVTKAFVQARIKPWWTLTAGRMDNPFLSTDAIFDPDLQFDGIAGEVTWPEPLFGFVGLRARGGAFPLDYGEQNFPITADVKKTTPQRWLFAGQIEGDYALPGKSELRLAAGYYHYANLRGRPSDPCALYLGATQCSSDGTAAFFVQKGNSLSFIRRIVLDPTLPSTTVQAQPQLLGLTQSYHVLDILAAYRLPLGDGIEASLVGDYMRNLAFRRANACRYGLPGQPVNNGGAGGSGNICDPVVKNRTPYVAGKNAFQVIASLGYPHPDEWGQWRVFAGYKYLESDAVLDAFNDDYFHLGGTNAKGYFIGGSIGLAKGTSIQTRWVSSNEVSGDPMAIDVLQFDINVRF